MTTRNNPKQFVICVSNDGFAASLEPRKVYEVLSDPAAEQHALLRVIDESGEDYLFPASLFQPLALSSEIQRALQIAS